MLIRPDGAPARKRRTQMNREDVKMVQTFERWCQSMGIALDLYCKKCMDTHGGKGARMWANNRRDATAFHLECQCTDRVYGQDAPRETPIISMPSVKPSVIVP